MLQTRRSRVQAPMRSLNFFNLPNSSSHTMAPGLNQPLTEINARKCFWGVEHGRQVRLSISPPSVSQLSRQCGILNISQLYRHPQTVTGRALLLIKLDTINHV
jgi:hypothetical protein